jgi:hypothetical protein
LLGRTWSASDSTLSNGEILAEEDLKTGKGPAEKIVGTVVFPTEEGGVDIQATRITQEPCYFGERGVGIGKMF